MNLKKKIVILIIVLTTILVCFLSLYGIILASGFFGFEISQIKKPETATSISSIFIVLLILLVPILILYLSETCLHKSKFFLRRYFYHSRFEFLLEYLVIGFALKGFAIIGAFYLTPDASWGFAVADFDFNWFFHFFWFCLALILNSLNEELIYRVYPIEKLWTINPKLVVIGTSVIFSLMHFIIETPDWGRFGYRLAFGILTAILYIKNGSLLELVGLHTGWNLASLSFSGNTDWRMGGIINTYASHEIEVYLNILILFCASIVLSFNSRLRTARRFAKLMDNNEYLAAGNFIHKNAAYLISGNLIQGKDAILKSYIDNYEKSRGKLDEIHFFSEIIKLNSQQMKIKYFDKICKNKVWHEHKREQIITFENDLICKIEHIDLPNKKSKVVRSL